MPSSNAKQTQAENDVTRLALRYVYRGISDGLDLSENANWSSEEIRGTLNVVEDALLADPTTLLRDWEEKGVRPLHPEFEGRRKAALSEVEAAARSRKSTNWVEYLEARRDWALGLGIVCYPGLWFLLRWSLVAGIGWLVPFATIGMFLASGALGIGIAPSKTRRGVCPRCEKATEITEERAEIATAIAIIAVMALSVLSLGPYYAYY